MLFGTIGMFLRWISLPSEIVVLLRGVIGALVVFLVIRLKGRCIGFNAIKQNLPWLILSGICLGLNWIFLFAAYLHTTVAVASLCNYLAPVIVVVLAPVLYQDRLGWKKLLCVAAAVLGVILISGIIGTAPADPDGIGILFGLLAALSFVAIILCNRKFEEWMPLTK